MQWQTNFPTGNQDAGWTQITLENIPVKAGNEEGGFDLASSQFLALVKK